MTETATAEQREAWALDGDARDAMYGLLLDQARAIREGWHIGALFYIGDNALEYEVLSPLIAAERECHEAAERLNW